MQSVAKAEATAAGKSDRIVERRLDGRQSRRRTGRCKSQQIAEVKRTGTVEEPQTQEPEYVVWFQKRWRQRKQSHGRAER